MLRTQFGQAVYEEGGAKDNDEHKKAQEIRADGRIGERVDGTDDATTHFEGAEDREGEGDDNEHEIPDLEHATSFLHHA